MAYEYNGKKVDAYKIIEKTALYRYAEMNNQIISVPNYLFRTRVHFNDTEEAVLIRRYQCIKYRIKIAFCNTYHPIENKSQICIAKSLFVFICLLYRDKDK